MLVSAYMESVHESQARPSPDPERQQIVGGRYCVTREIARSGTSTVFEAKHVYLGCPVALKRPRGAPESNERLLHEASVLGHLRHRGVVRILDAGEEDGWPFVALELLEGRTLQGILAARERLSVEDVATLGRQLGEGLAAAHDHGVVHRDVRPGSIFVTVLEDGEEEFRLFDFGIAGFHGKHPVDDRLGRGNPTLGAPEYMAPERLRNEDPLDKRSDVYSLGVTLYECLTGSVPFDGALGEVLHQVSTQSLPSVRESRPDVPEAMVRVLERALSYDPRERFPDASAFVAAWSAATTSLNKALQLLGPCAPGSAPRRGAREKRRYVRAPYITPLRIVESGGAHVDGRSEDISEGGLLVVTDQEWSGSDVVKCRFALPQSGRIAEVSAGTRWVRQARDRRAVGLEFLNLPGHAREEIRSYVALLGK